MVENKSANMSRASQFKRYLGPILGGMTILALLVGAIIGTFIYQQYQNLPDVSVLTDYKPSLITRIYDDKRDVICEYYHENRVMVSIDQVPMYYIDALLAIEDTDFFTHYGVNIKANLRAALLNLRAGRIVQGASTLTQQLTKLLFFGPEKTYSRKIKEILLALQIEQLFSKEEILELYCNQIYFGNGAYGVHSAASEYFGKELRELSLEECALLGGIVQRPNGYNPFHYPELALNRRNIVLNRMAEVGFISRKEAAAAIAAPIVLRKQKSYRIDSAPYFNEYVRRMLADKYGQSAIYKEGMSVYSTLNLELQQYAEKAMYSGLAKHNKRLGRYDAVQAEGSIVEIQREQHKIKSADELWTLLRSGKEVSGVIKAIEENPDEPPKEGKPQKSVVIVDLGYGVTAKIPFAGYKWIRILRSPEEDAQKTELYRYRIRSAEEELARGQLVPVRAVDPDNIVADELVLELVIEQTLQGALVCLDAQSGEIKAMVGGFDPLKFPFNRAYQAHRQPGSSFKPFIFAAAISKGYTAGTTVVDSPIAYVNAAKSKKGGELSLWRPQNYYQKYYGPTTLKEALVHSLNVATIKLLQDIGVGYTVRFLRRFGFEGNMNYDLTLGLGTSEVTPLGLTGAYTAFANSGIPVLPFGIRRIEDHNGNLIEHTRVRELEGIPEDVNYIMVDMLKAVVRYGTGFVAKSIGHEVGAKTGTTQRAIDSWFAGFSSDLVCVVYVGYDDRQPMAQRSTGAEVAGPIWRDFMRQALSSQPKRNFPVPDNITFVEIDRYSGMLPGQYCKSKLLQAYIAGTEPQKICDQHEENRLFGTELDYSLIDHRISIRESLGPEGGK